MSYHNHCGHPVEDEKDAIHVRLGHESCDYYGYHPCVEYFTYCPACAEKASKHDTFIPSDVPDDWWFNHGYAIWRKKIVAAMRASEQ